MIRAREWILLGGLICVAVYGQLTDSSRPHAQARSAQGIRAITKPSADVTVSFVQPGRIANVMQEKGTAVTSETLLARLDDTVEQFQLAQIEATAHNITQLDASMASLEQKRLDLKKMEKAALAHAATDLEVEHARLDVRIAELSLALAQFEHEQAVRKFAEAKERIAHMRLLSPINGIVEEVYVESGESVNALDEVMRIVQIDPLWIDASIPLVKAMLLKKGQSVQVTFTEPNAVTVSGRVTAMSAVADAASLTLPVRIEVPNPEGRPAGEQVRVFCESSSEDLPAGTEIGAP